MLSQRNNFKSFPQGRRPGDEAMLSTIGFACGMAISGHKVAICLIAAICYFSEKIGAREQVLVILYLEGNHFSG